jgi:hypothetical protein
MEHHLVAIERKTWDSKLKLVYVGIETRKHEDFNWKNIAISPSF